MRAHYWALCLAVSTAHADALEEALDLIEAHSATVQATAEEASLISQRSAWESQVRIGYNQRSSDDNAAGWNAGLTVTIPLWDKKRDIEALQARTRHSQSRTTLHTHFLNDLKTLRLLAISHHAETNLQQFEQDRLRYHREAVETGQLSAMQLWPLAETAQKSAQQQKKTLVEYHAERERIARLYGGHEWTRLQVLLDALTKSNSP